LNAEILAVSNDQLTGGERAIDHLDLGFPALFDPEAVVIERFDVYGTLNDG
jgi:peroxiredoxin